jgi:uncharacterized protein YcbK (DUF882 family)
MRQCASRAKRHFRHICSRPEGSGGHYHARMSPSRPPSDRRRFLRLGAVAAVPLVAPAARASMPGERRLALVHTHTRERVNLAYAAGERYIPAAMATLDRFLRDHYSGDVGRIDAQLFDLLYRVHRELGASEDVPFEIISGYRAPTTNARLRESRGGGVARHSLHMEGRALDIRLPAVPLADLRDAALALRAGGVGFYAREQFVHIDTGRVRAW